jgi:hypothetical protein
MLRGKGGCPMKFARLGFLALLVLASSCATVAHGRFQEVPVTSHPAGAAIYADCGNGPERVGETPMVVKMRRKADRCIVTLHKDGYEEASAILKRHTSGWVWGNLLLSDGALVGAIVDLYDGAWYNRTPAAVRVRLTPLPESGIGMR